jgi:multicomponent Na+:H+ antiporter subunit E
MKTKVATFFIMLAFWVIMSGMFDGFHFSLGVLCCLLVTHFSHDLLFPENPDKNNKSRTNWTSDIIGLILYLPYILWQVLIANLQVAWIVLHPRGLEMIDPHIFRFYTKLTRPISKVTFAQSITLTPGTITVNIYRDPEGKNPDQFAVYALTKEAAASLPGDMENRVAKALEPVND